MGRARKQCFSTLLFSVTPHLILCLQVITLEGWVDIMYYVMDAHSFYNFIYFILLIIVSTPLYCTVFIVVLVNSPLLTHKLVVKIEKASISS